jgi:hypothetical protein
MDHFLYVSLAEYSLTKWRGAKDYDGLDAAVAGTLGVRLE